MNLMVTANQKSIIGERKKKELQKQPENLTKWQ